MSYKITNEKKWQDDIHTCSSVDFVGLSEKYIFKLDIRCPSSSLHGRKPPLGFQEGSRQN